MLENMNKKISFKLLLRIAFKQRMFFNIKFHEIKESIFFFFLKYLNFKFYTIDRPLGSHFRKRIIIFRNGGGERSVSAH